MEGSILLESGERVIVAVPQGELCVYNKPRLEFIRPKWTDDSGASQCLYCKSKFTQIRRKHHCRSCGRLFCSKCCNDKTVLTHLGMTDSERTCAICKPVLSLMSKAFAADNKLKTEAAAGFLEFIQAMKHMQELLEMGGLHTLVWLCGTNCAQVNRYVVPALHVLSTQVSLQKYLLEAGIVQALSSIMQSFESSEKVISDCISTLLILSLEGAQQVVLDGGLSSLLMIINRVDEVTRLLALQTIMRTCSVPQAHAQIMSNMQTIQYITSLINNNQDLQVSTLVFKVFAEISAAHPPIYTLSLSEMETTSSYISKFLKREHNDELLCNVTCLAANLAHSPESQPHLTAVVSRLGALLTDSSSQYYQHVIRALSNFSQYLQHTFILVPLVPKVVSALHSTNSDKRTENHALSVLVNLLAQSPDMAGQNIIRENGELFLTKLMRAPGVATSINKALSEVAVNICRP